MTETKKKKKTYSEEERILADALHWLDQVIPQRQAVGLRVGSSEEGAEPRVVGLLQLRGQLGRVRVLAAIGTVQLQPVPLCVIVALVI
jgi:hypothetical protein